mgnify:CR=1 FL=1
MEKGISNQNNNLKERFIEFTLNIIKISKELNKSIENNIFSNQIIRSTSSIGANYQEAQAAQSKKEFITKIYISLKEANESYYWLELIERNNQIKLDKIKNECIEIIKILTSIIKTSKK